MDPVLFRGEATRTLGIPGYRGGPNGAIRKGFRERDEAGARARPTESQKFPRLTRIYHKFPQGRESLGGAQSRSRGEAEKGGENAESPGHLGPRPGWFGLGPGAGLLGGGWPWSLSPLLGPYLGTYPSLCLGLLAGLRLAPLLSYALASARSPV